MRIKINSILSENIDIEEDIETSITSKLQDLSLNVKTITDVNYLHDQSQSKVKESTLMNIIQNNLSQKSRLRHKVQSDYFDQIQSIRTMRTSIESSTEFNTSFQMTNTETETRRSPNQQLKD